jgi:hypothetical protein
MVACVAAWPIVDSVVVLKLSASQAVFKATTDMGQICVIIQA